VRDHGGHPLSTFGPESLDRPSDTSTSAVSVDARLDDGGSGGSLATSAVSRPLRRFAEVSGGRHGKHRLGGLRAVRAIGPGCDPVCRQSARWRSGHRFLACHMPPERSRHGRRWSPGTPPPSDAARQTVCRAADSAFATVSAHRWARRSSPATSGRAFRSPGSSPRARPAGNPARAAAGGSCAPPIPARATGLLNPRLPPPQRSGRAERPATPEAGGRTRGATEADDGGTRSAGQCPRYCSVRRPQAR
jgi:hypothetical protein